MTDTATRSGVLSPNRAFIILLTTTGTLQWAARVLSRSRSAIRSKESRRNSKTSSYMCAIWRAGSPGEETCVRLRRSYTDWRLNSMTDFAGRVALVTGANRGIGLEVTRQLARLGFRCILGSRDD